jgi:hypothetical protein
LETDPLAALLLVLFRSNGVHLLEGNPPVIPRVAAAVGTCTVTVSVGAEGAWHKTWTDRTHAGDPDGRFHVVQDWAGSAVPDTHPELAELKRRLVAAPLVDAATALCAFRGRLFGETDLPDSDRMGPPPPTAVGGDNRYSTGNEPALYLVEASTFEQAAEGIRRELAKFMTQTSRLWVQQFAIPASALRIADFTAISTRDYMNLVFDFAENGDPSAFSRIVGRAVANAGFDGMRVPGVRGDADFHYSNLTIFDPHARWQPWVRAFKPWPA